MWTIEHRFCLSIEQFLGRVITGQEMWTIECCCCLAANIFLVSCELWTVEYCFCHMS